MIGIVADSIVNNPQNYLMFRGLNELAKTHECYLFTDRIESLPMQNNFAILSSLEALHHTGVLIGTSIINAQIVKNSLTAKEKYLYLWYPDWMLLNSFSSVQLSSVLYNPEIKILARSNDHFNLYSRLISKPVGVMFNWDIEYIKSELLK